jgi:hypothetical protein
MLATLMNLLALGESLYHWSAPRKKERCIDPRQQYLATLLLVSTSAVGSRNNELYQAAIKEIVQLMSKECWERPEIEWRIRQAVQIAQKETSAELSEKVTRVGSNIARWTVYSPKALPWEARPLIKLLAQSTQSTPTKLLAVG